ncbi:hypothetical protein EYF80_045482 [Liparis tanakae]|uniref:Uncharacterized protein n=1 Tax=Liparis tanakae TaxID=230148 RepID=A0A4Z2FT28_9TELE|nr:hypothetical protein EYF80_045482 [Liparis tanakae]
MALGFFGGSPRGRGEKNRSCSGSQLARRGAISRLRVRQSVTVGRSAAPAVGQQFMSLSECFSDCQTLPPTLKPQPGPLPLLPIQGCEPVTPSASRPTCSPFVCSPLFSKKPTEALILLSVPCRRSPPENLRVTRGQRRATEASGIWGPAPIDLMPRSQYRPSAEA